MTNSAMAAKAIKAELKRAFSQIKFSVRSENFSGGNAVRISYDNGVPREEVEKVVGKYQYGSFDSSTDCYEYTNGREDIPQAKYVQVQRSISKDIQQSTKERLAEEYGFKDMNDEEEWRKKCGMWSDQAVYRALNGATL